VLACFDQEQLTYSLSVECANNEVFEISTIVLVVLIILILILIFVFLVILFLLLSGLGLGLCLAFAFALDAVGLGILHVLILILILSGLEQLLDGSSLLLLLDLGRIARSTIGLLLVLVIVRGSEQCLHVLVVNLLVLILVVKTRESSLDQPQSGAGNSRDIAFLVGLGLLGRVQGSHCDAELVPMVSRVAMQRFVQQLAPIMRDCGWAHCVRGKNGTHRSREVHGGRDQDLAGRDLEAINGTRNSRHFARLFGNVRSNMVIIDKFQRESLISSAWWLAEK
jgi:hypothetical protein